MKVKTLALSLLSLMVLIACLQTPIAMARTIPPPPPPATLLWADPVDVNDIALSKDGRYVAVATYDEVRFYSRSSGTPIWVSTDEVSFLSVAISADGDCVAVGFSTPDNNNGEGGVAFFRDATDAPPGGVRDPTWTGDDLGGPIDRRCLDISDDGNYVVAGGTGDTIFYWKDAKADGRDGSTTWTYELVHYVDAVDLSSDGNYIAAGNEDNVAYWKDARTRSPSECDPNWISTYPETDVLDVAVSDDGDYVVAASRTVTTLYYWAGAKSLDDDPEATWQTDSDVHFSSVDMSSDGDKVVAGGFNTTSAEPGVYFWNGAKGMTGNPQKQTWTYTTVGIVHDVAINDAGDYMAAANDVFAPYVYFLDNKGDLKWQYGPLDNEAFVVSISSDGGTLAIATNGGASGLLVSTGYPIKPVGGLAVPPDKLALLSPWIAVALAAVALTIFATKRRREL